jgi:diaminohydroxyphosphoribosylaminopyrimidine deaminase/5-amino-6-(5-phosphoribosylamino)uracil reductase
MAKALQLAENGLYSTAPNPRVGCVIVKNGQIIAQGWHRVAGAAHAEIEALSGLSSTEAAQGATVYVTLEPCSHTGKTPPCCERLIAAGVNRVVAAMRDPNPLVSGKGFERMTAAGIEVLVGILENEARALNPGFIKRMESGLPYVRCKLAMSVDGRTAMASGESQWITGPAARSDVQRYRARSSAIITGSGTVIHDNPSLNVREEMPGVDTAHAPLEPVLRVVVASTFNIDSNARMFSLPGEIVIAGSADNDNKRKLDNAGICTWLVGEAGLPVDLTKLLKLLADRGCNEVLIEAGSTLSGAFLQAGLVDELVIYIAPKVLGHLARPLFTLPGLDRMADQIKLSIKDTRLVGDDLRINAIVSPP